MKNFNKNERTTSTVKDSQVLYAKNAFRLGTKGSVIALQERNGVIFVCVKKGEESIWAPFQKFMSQMQLQSWLSTGGFPRVSNKS